MIQSDALSGQPNHSIDESTGKDEQVLLLDDFYWTQIYKIESSMPLRKMMISEKPLKR